MATFLRTKQNTLNNLGLDKITQQSLRNLWKKLYALQWQLQNLLQRMSKGFTDTSYAQMEETTQKSHSQLWAVKKRQRWKIKANATS